ncbi:transposase [Shimia aestuarii]
MLDLVVAQLKILQIARLKKSCRRCEKMVQTPAPSRPIPGSMVSAVLLAWILVSKFDDHLPLYRLNEIFARMGADIPDSTLVDWCGRAMQVLAPLVERFEADVMASDLLHAPSRQHASHAPAGQWMTPRSGYWTDPSRTAASERE